MLATFIIALVAEFCDRAVGQFAPPTLPLRRSISSPNGCYAYTDCSSCENGLGFMKEKCAWCAFDNRCYGTLNFCPLLMRAQIAYNCPVSLDRIPKYNETFARSVALPLMAATYAPDSDTRQKCLQNHFGKSISWKVYTVPCNLDNTTECLGYTAYIRRAGAVAIVFRGSTRDQLLPQALNFIFGKKMRKIDIVGGSVDEYYYDAFTKLWSVMKIDIRNTLKNGKWLSVWVFGHSLGGGLASITSAVLVASGIVPSNKIKLITFGQPRITDSIFAQRHDQLVPYSFRIINRNDLVPTQPARMSPFETNGHFHHRYEVWYPNGMSPGARYIIAAMAEDGAGRASSINLAADDHSFMFEKQISKWWNSGCQP